MKTFSQSIKTTVGKDIIEAVVIEHTPDYLDSPKFSAGNSLAGKIISYDVALSVLDYLYDSGFGSQDCHDITMWSKNYVYFIHEYNGSTSIEYLPRNPTPY